MTAYSILRLLPSPPAAITGGRILFNGENLLDLPEKKMRRIRGGKISIIFQEPLTSLNPVFRVGSQIAEVLQVHTDMSAKDALEMSRAAAARCGDTLTGAAHCETTRIK